MPKTKPTAKQQAQLDQKIETEEDDVATHKPVKAVERNRHDDNTDKEELQKALKDLLIRLGSRDIDDLKQMSFVSLKIRDPMSKGLAYYDASLPMIEKQCDDLLDWHIEKCKQNITDTENLIKSIEKDETGLAVTESILKDTQQEILNKINVGAPEDEISELNEDIRKLESEIKAIKERLDPPVPPSVVVRKKSFWDKILGSPKVITSPDLEVYDAKSKLTELRELLADLVQTKLETVAVNTDKMYFKSWAYNYLLLCRSQLGEDNFLKMMVMLTDGQIVNKQESGGIDMSKVFSR